MFSIIVPCYNEPYKELMRNLAIMDGYFDYQPEYLIMENGSSLIYKKMEYRSRFRYFWRYERGLGWALKEGLKRASSPMAFFLPADLSYDLSFVKLAKAYLEVGYSLVIGSKALGDSEVHRPLKREIASSCYNLLLKLRYGAGWPADITGTKGYARKDMLPLLDSCPSDGIRFEVELMKAIRQKGLRSKEIAVKVNDHRPSPFNLLGRGR